MDVIAEWFSAARIEGTVFSRTEGTAPWGLEFPAAPRVAFHVVTRGQAAIEPLPSGRPIHLAQGDVVLLPSGRAHRLVSSPGAEAAPLFPLLQRRPLGPDRTIRVGGGGAGATVLCGAFGLDASNAGPLLRLLPGIVHLPFDPAPGNPIPSIVQLLAQEFTPPAPASAAVTGRLADVLLLFGLRAWSARQPEGSQGWLTSLRDPALARALAKLHERPAHDWTVEALAGEAGLSRAAFARRFRALVGEPPLTYLTRWRMALASRMLADTRAPLAEIGARVGYVSEFAFNRAFSREQGLAPGRWRERAGAASPA